MTFPNPPGDIPLYEGLGAEWNDIVGALPEDKRAELAPKLKERLDRYAPLEPYIQFQRSGISPDHIGTALNLYNIVENNPQQVYNTIGQHLGITPQQAKAVVEEVKKEEATTAPTDPNYESLKQQVEVLAQIALTQRDLTTQEQQIQQADAQIEKELGDLKKKYGESEVNEDEIIMRMMHKNMTAEQAYTEWAGLASNIRQRRPAPMLLGGAGAVPNRAIDPTKLSSKDTRALVTQMMQNAMHEDNR